MGILEVASTPVKSIFQGGPWNQTPLTAFLIQVVIVILLCKVLAFFFKYIKQPPVIAEVVAGIILGPSVLGQIPGFTKHVFTGLDPSMTTFNIFAQIGLILFMFIVGLEIDTKIMKRNAKHALVISVAAMITPFALGCGTSWVIHHKIPTGASYSSFLLFVAVAMSITAFPVLARILTETKILHTNVGTLALSAAAVDDVVAWCLLALVVAYAKASSPLDGLWTFLCLIAFFIFMILIIRPALASFAKRRMSSSNVKFYMVIIMLIGVFICSWFTEIIGVHAMFGGFVLGIVTPRQNSFAHKLIGRIEDIVIIFLLPLYFTFSGLRTDIGTLNNGVAWGLVILVIVTACVGKFLGGMVAAKLLKNTWRDSATVGVLMNTKGLVELIVLNVGLDAKVLNTEIFTIFVIMALVTTVATTPVVHWIYVRHQPKDEVEVSMNSYSIVLAVQTKKTAPDLVTVSSFFGNIKPNVELRTLFLTEISDRPSSYFFSEFYNTFQDAPFLKGKSRKGILLEMQTNLKGAGMKEQLNAKNLASSNLPNELTQYVNFHQNSLLILDLHHSVHMSDKHTKNQAFDIRQSISVAVESSAQRVFNWGPSASLYQTSLKRAQCAVAVLIHKNNQNTTNPMGSLSSILFLHAGKEYEDFALSALETLRSSVKVTMITSTTLKLNDRMAIIQSDDPLAAENFEDAASDVDLIVMGASRDDAWSGYYSDPVVASNTPVLLIFPPKIEPLRSVDVHSGSKYTFSNKEEEAKKSTKSGSDSPNSGSDSPKSGGRGRQEVEFTSLQ